jgi:hypothetical protein
MSRSPPVLCFTDRSPPTSRFPRSHSEFEPYSQEALKKSVEIVRDAEILRRAEAALQPLTGFGSGAR